MRPRGRGSIIFVMLLLCFPLAAALAQSEPQEQDPRALLRSLHFQSGQISLRDGLATLAVGPNFAYVDPQDAETFLVKIWSNPPGAGERTLGLLLPKDVNMLSTDGWAVVVGYDESGYVSDSDANSIDYDELLNDMEKSAEESNAARRERGFAPVTLVGWAAPPRYDQATHKLYWAKRLRFEGNGADTLNYNIRALGRRGVLVLNVVASIDQLPMVERRVPEILGMVTFNQGHTYAEYDPNVDKMAAYGIAGLIAGGVLLKAGFFKVLLAGILAFKKVLIVGAIAALGAGASFFKRLFRKAPS